MRWRKTREEKTPQTNKMLAFKSTPTIFDENEEEEEEEEDEDLSLLVKSVRRMYNKAKVNNREDNKARRIRRLFGTTVGNPDMSLSNTRRTKQSPQLLRNHIRRKL